MTNWNAAFRAELETMEKEAIFGALLGGLGHAAAAGAAGHVGANVLGTAAHHTNIGEMMAHRGFQDALTGSKMNRASMFAQKYLMGPESLAGYQLAHQAGSKLKDMHTVQQNAAIAGGSLMQHLSPELKDSPLLGDISKAMEHHLKGTAPTLADKGHKTLLGSTVGKAQGHLQNFLANRTDTQFDSTAKRVMNTVAGAAPVAAAAVADTALTGAPAGLLAHMGVNKARAAIGQSAFGKKVMGDMFQKGMRGEEISKGRELATNLIVSPGLLDPYRVGKAVHTTANRMGPNAGAYVEGLGKMPIKDAFGKVKDLGQIPGQVADTARGMQGAYNVMKPKPPMTPTQGLGVAAGTAGLAGAGYLASQQMDKPDPPAGQVASAVRKPLMKTAHEEGEPVPEPAGLFEMSENTRRGAQLGRGIRMATGGRPLHAHQQRALGLLLAAALTQKQAGDLAACVGV